MRWFWHEKEQKYKKFTSPIEEVELGEDFDWLEPYATWSGSEQKWVITVGILGRRVGEAKTKKHAIRKARYYLEKHRGMIPKSIKQHFRNDGAPPDVDAEEIINFVNENKEEIMYG